MRKHLGVLMISIVIFGALTLVATASALPSSIRLAVSYTLYGTGANPHTDQYDRWDYDGVHWWDGPRTNGIPISGVEYYVNTKSPAIVVAVKAAFETWDARVAIELFDDNVKMISKGAGNRLDGRNVVSWGALRPGIVAVTYIWYYSDTLEIVEIGMVFNKLYTWGIDPDGEGPATINAFDIQNVATHEAGHTLSLNDLYMSEATQLTMYGYTSPGETMKRSLGLGDINGIHHIYDA